MIEKIHKGVERPVSGWKLVLAYDGTDFHGWQVQPDRVTIQGTLADAIKHRGSSLADEQYRDLFGELGDFQGSHQVYDREGESCRRCRNVIVRVKTGGRSTFFCEHCQV